MRILWLTNVPSPYRVDFFNELGKLCNLTVLFEKETSDERDKSWKNYHFSSFTGYFLKGKSIDTDSAFCPSVLKFIRKNEFDHIIITNISSPTGILAIVFMKVMSIPYWIEGDGGFAKSVHGLRKRIKKFLFRGASGYLSTSKAHDDYYLECGADREKIIRYPFTSVKQEDLINAELFTAEDKKSLRQKLSIVENKLVITFLKYSCEKEYKANIDILLQLAVKLGSSFGIYIVNDEPTRTLLNIVSIPENVHFLGNLEQKELAKYYAASDCFAMVFHNSSCERRVLEAMLFGLPIIETSDCVNELNLVINGDNGFVVSKDDIHEMAISIELASSSNNNLMFSKSSLGKINNFALDNKSLPYIHYINNMSSEKKLIMKYLARYHIGVPNDKKIVLYVGQMIHRKGIDILLECAASISCERKDVIYLFVGGELPKEYMPIYEKIPCGCVYFIPYVQKEELKYYFRSTDIFCLPTREDIWGLVINEALVFGIPVITTSMCVAGLELIRDGYNGYLVPPNDSKQLAKKITLLLNDNSSYKDNEEDNHSFVVSCNEFGKRSREIIKNYTIEKMSECHINVFARSDSE